MMDDRSAFLRATWANVLGNVLKILVEGTVGVMFGSLALIADAAHSLADLLASLIVLVWGRLSFEGPDRTHPHGHERIEPLTALFVGATLVVLGARILYDAGLAVLHAPDVVFDPLLVAGLAFGVLDMVLVYRYTTLLNETLESPALDALAADCLNDVYTSLAAVVGVFGAAIGEPMLDPIAGALVSVLVIREGVAISRENITYLVGRAPPEEELDAIRDAVLSHAEVAGIHDFTAHYVGTDIEVEFHAEVADEHTLREAHDLETELRERVMALPDVGDVHIHLDPAGMGEWKDAPEN
ncbi:cation transporter [Salarchaeum sp. JOR-1]|nr:cation transporter [Salarchaeum sp. JOR-1]